MQDKKVARKGMRSNQFSMMSGNAMDGERFLEILSLFFLKERESENLNEKGGRVFDSYYGS